MNWIQIKIFTAPEHADKVEACLEVMESAAITFQDAKDQPVFEPERGTTPLWQHTIVTGLFDADCDATALKPMFEACWQHHSEEAAPQMKVELLEDKDWEREWMDNFHPIQCGERLWICPSWRETPNENAVNLKLDPGLAFGTGTHPTTFLCLQWLDQANVAGKQVIDYGCGSGILGIAALLLGAKHMVGVDNDPQALLATEDNAQRNDIPTTQFTCFLPEDVPQDIEQADLVVANILAGPLVSLKPVISSLVKPGGQLILSGILQSQAQSLADAYSADFEITEIESLDDWVRIVAIKP